MSSTTKFFLIMFVIFGALGYAGVQDFDEENRAVRRAYCERVIYGLHPNFRSLDCGQHDRNIEGSIR